MFQKLHLGFALKGHKMGTMARKRLLLSGDK